MNLGELLQFSSTLIFTWSSSPNFKQIVNNNIMKTSFESKFLYTQICFYHYSNIMKALNCDHCFYANQLVVKLLRNLSTFQKSKTHFITNEDDCYFRAQLLFADRLFSASIIFPEVGNSISFNLISNRIR